jgi:hypothetical protein
MRRDRRAGLVFCRLLRLGFLPVLFAFAVDLAEGNEDETGEGKGDEEGGDEAVELLDLSIEEGQADEDKDDMGAEDLERGLAEGEEGLA